VAKRLPCCPTAAALPRYIGRCIDLGGSRCRPDFASTLTMSGETLNCAEARVLVVGC
jgi:hypothetical protein